MKLLYSRERYVHVILKTSLNNTFSFSTTQSRWEISHGRLLDRETPIFALYDVGKQTSALHCPILTMFSLISRRQTFSFSHQVVFPAAKTNNISSDLSVQTVWHSNWITQTMAQLSHLSALSVSESSFHDILWLDRKSYVLAFLNKTHLEKNKTHR